MIQVHYSRAKAELKNRLVDFYTLNSKNIKRILLIDDVFGRFHILFWGSNKIASTFEKNIKSSLGNFLDQVIAIEGDATNDFSDIWEGAPSISGTDSMVRVVSRHRSKPNWFEEAKRAEGILKAKSKIVSFYSFKGGVGRTTCLVSCAMQFAHEGKRVVIVDLDLDAPGVSSLLVSRKDVHGEFGLVDFLVDSYSVQRPELSEYCYKVRDEILVGSGEIVVFPCGKLEENYIEMLSRVDYESDMSGGERAPIHILIRRIIQEMEPDYLFIDSRSGIGDSSGIATSELVDCVVVVGVQSKQTWDGLRLIIRKLGAIQVLNDKPQINCLLVQTMIPRENKKISEKIKQEFIENAFDIFSEEYYGADLEIEAEDSANYWLLSDATNSDSAHRPETIDYQPMLSSFSDIREVLDILKGDEYVGVYKAIKNRL